MRNWKARLFWAARELFDAIHAGGHRVAADGSYLLQRIAVRLAPARWAGAAT
jgi:hypothetical protein